jgi:membrane-associated phospholipid phosphatase
MSILLRRVLVLVLLLTGGSAPGSLAQSAAEPAPFCEEPERRRTLDTRGLAALYCAPSPALTTSMEAVHASARPLFYGTVPVAWGLAGLRGGTGAAPAYRLTLVQGGTYGLVVGLKRLVGRPRPYVRRALPARADRYGPSKGDKYRAFPSGHASLSAALATSVSLTHPTWYVIGPGAAWALGVSLSRLYLGVHYPSDVLVGAVLGAGVAVAVHLARGLLTPPRIDGTPANGASAPVGVQIRF